MRLRILSALILMPPVLWLLLFGKIVHLFFLFLPLSVIALYEWLRAADAQIFSPTRYVVLSVAGWLLLWSAYENFVTLLPLEILLTFFLLGVMAMVHWSSDRSRFSRIASEMTGLIFCVLPLVLLLLAENLWSGDHLRPLLFLLLIIWATDTGAYFSGKQFGKRKLAPRISPGKTWVGAVGGSLFSVMIGLLVAPLLPESMHPEILHVLLLTILISVGGQLGDLMASMVKREVGIKDFGRLIPGHGGVLDRLDSLLFAAPIFYLYLYLYLHLHLHAVDAA